MSGGLMAVAGSCVPAESVARPVIAGISSGVEEASNTITVSHTTPAGSNRHLLVLAAAIGSPYPSTATFGGVGLNDVDDNSNNNPPYVVYMIFEKHDPAVGTADIVVNYSNSGKLMVLALALNDVGTSGEYGFLRNYEHGFTEIDAGSGGYSPSPHPTDVLHDDNPAYDAKLEDLVFLLINNSPKVARSFDSGFTEVAAVSLAADAGELVLASKPATPGDTTWGYTIAGADTRSVFAAMVVVGVPPA